MVQFAASHCNDGGSLRQLETQVCYLRHSPAFLISQHEPHSLTKQCGALAHGISVFNSLSSFAAKSCAQHWVINKNTKVFEPFFRRPHQEAVFAMTYDLSVGPDVRADRWDSHIHAVERFQ